MARKERTDSKILDVDASMQGTLAFKDPVNLRINGNFEGKLDTKGSLTIGQNAAVVADIKGEDITVSGKVTGNITALKRLSLLSHAHVVGDISAPKLSIEEGAILQGRSHMMNLGEGNEKIFNAEELARYLEVEVSNIVDWAKNGKLPGFKENNEWKFDRAVVDSWIANEKDR